MRLSVQIAGLRFVFLINQELISLIKAEAAKMNQPWCWTRSVLSLSLRRVLAEDLQHTIIRALVKQPSLDLEFRSEENHLEIWYAYYLRHIWTVWEHCPSVCVREIELLLFV